MNKKPNDLTVPAAIHELEKNEYSRKELWQSIKLTQTAAEMNYLCGVSFGRMVSKPKMGADRMEENIDVYKHYFK